MAEIKIMSNGDTVTAVVRTGGNEYKNECPNMMFAILWAEEMIRGEEK